MYCISLHASTTAKTLKVSNILCLIQMRFLKSGDNEMNAGRIENISPQNNNYCLLATRLQRYGLIMPTRLFNGGSDYFFSSCLTAIILQFLVSSEKSSWQGLRLTVAITSHRLVKILASEIL